MFIFLPPSEGKAVPPAATASGDARGVVIGSLILPDLGPARLKLITALEELCSGPADAAAAAWA